jgi:hypothetical protein
MLATDRSHVQQANAGQHEPRFRVARPERRQRREHARGQTDGTGQRQYGVDRQHAEPSLRLSVRRQPPGQERE